MHHYDDNESRDDPRYPVEVTPGPFAKLGNQYGSGCNHPKVRLIHPDYQECPKCHGKSFPNTPEAWCSLCKCVGVIKQPPNYAPLHALTGSLSQSLALLLNTLLADHARLTGECAELRKRLDP